MVTAALIVFGLPGYMASGVDATHIAGKGSSPPCDTGNSET